MSTITYLGAGAALALAMVVPTVASAQTGKTMTPVELQAALNAAKEHGTAPIIFFPHNPDNFGVVGFASANEAYKALGSWELVRAATRDNKRFCEGTADIEELKKKIRDADVKVKEADRLAAEAQTKAERKAAAARQTRARNDFVRLLLVGIKVGLVSQIPGVGWAYAGYVVAHEFDGILARAQHRKEMGAYDAQVDANDARIYAMSLRLDALDLRNELHDLRGEVFDASISGWCSSLKYWHSIVPQRDVNASYAATYAPGAAAAKQAPPSGAKPKDWEGFK